MEWWIRVVSPIRRVWIRVAARIRMRKSGLGPLRNEVSTCEYEDVQVMWEMLRKATDVEIGRAVRPRERRVDTWSVFEWAGRGRRRVRSSRWGGEKDSHVPDMCHLPHLY
ncbi:uncharacterized protein A4U43_C07F29770 [Asparagus officinalis]|uniref:Uncharacterized protein n=1 Tax=Asparagus officinalis TaxID=4686 RepID=A0A5P1EG09_ASPOF|nr:uncharacterized protein A4U43_C07F29770 [Asparagus officinalis]